jgi:transcriptional regulator with XRE-family HTH domain
MSRSISVIKLAFPASAALVRLGADVRRARVRRSLTLDEVATRCSLAVPTIRKIETGNPTVALGALAAVLWVLGLQDRIAGVLASDPVGEGLESLRRPKRVRSPVEDLF